MAESDIFDSAFFGFARTGTYREKYEYPCMIRTGQSAGPEEEGATFEVFGTRFERDMLHPFSDESSREEYVVSGDLVILKDAPALIARSRKFVSTMMDIHERFGFSKLIYASGIADPYLLPVLVYLGINIFDDILPNAFAKNGLYTGIFGLQNAPGVNPSANVEMCNRIIAILKSTIENRTLREVVEKYQFSSKAIEILRILDSDYVSEQQRNLPAFVPYIKSSGEHSLQNPMLQRYRDRIMESYIPPPGRDILLLIPCSARKPYSSSNSHKRIIEAISEYRKHIHELIVTSPLGLVPRDLEEVFPAAFYDIPVIGQWYEGEKVMITGMLSDYLRKNSYRKVIAFISDDLEFISKVLPENSIIITGSSKNHEDLEKLKTAIADAIDAQRSSKSGKARFEAMLSMARFQYGDWIMDYIQDAKLIRSYHQEMLSRSGKILMVLNPKIGKITITKEIAPAFLDNRKRIVYIDDFKPTANVYAVGVLDATNDVTPEDEVVVVHNDEVRGVGIAKMPRAAMINLKKGTAVKMRN